MKKEHSLMHFTPMLGSFNPCSNGMKKEQKDGATPLTKNFVLILVLME